MNETGASPPVRARSRRSRGCDANITYTLRLPSHLLRRLDERADREDRSRSSLIRAAVVRLLEAAGDAEAAGE